MMSVTKTRVAEVFNVPRGTVKQYGSKQLFQFYYKGRNTLVSYLTIVAQYETEISTWVYTGKKFSRTTSAHISYHQKLKRV